MINIKNKTLNKMTFIDLFAGLGGFRLALESFGAKCVFSSEIDEFAKEVYAANFNEKPYGDITLIDEKSIPDHDILCAGFPCQPFSISGKQAGFEDSRGTLFFDIVRIVKEKKPSIIFMENVKNFERHDDGKTINVVKNTLIDLGYSFHSSVLNAADFGIPQKRERIYMVCFKNNLKVDKFNFPKPLSSPVSLENILLSDNDVSFLHTSRKDLIIKNVESIKSAQKPIRIGSVGKGGQGERIYSPKGTAITLSAQGGGVFAKTGGYLINGKVRRLHPRECARIMGFPDSYTIHRSYNQAYKQFGNSVVVDVLQHILISISDTLYEYLHKEK